MRCWICDATDRPCASGRPRARQQGRDTPFVCVDCAARATHGTESVDTCTFCGRHQQRGITSPRASVCTHCGDLVSA